MTLLLFSCVSQVQSNNDFYLGLLEESDTEKIKLFEKALVNSNEYIRRSAAEELAILMSRGTDLSRKTTERVRAEIHGFWAEAFDIVSVLDKEKTLSFLFKYELNSASFSEVRRFILNECADKEIIFTELETAAIEGHYSVSCLRYNEALIFFRAFQQDDNWTEHIPEIFINYPVLANDLGRTFQYTQSGGEGLTLFLQWLTDSDLPVDLQYQLNFYAGRIARRMGGRNAQGISLFEKALALAPDGEQKDACIWYILDLIITGPTRTFIERLTQLVPQWHSSSYYNDILERFLHKLISLSEWNNIIRTYSLIQNTGADASKIGFTRAIARLIENNYLTAADMRLAAQIINVESPDQFTFYRIAYNIGIVSSIPALFYRSQCADVLNEPFLELTEEITEYEEKDYSQVMQFILGFFNYGAVDFSLSYIRELEKELTDDELRVTAQLLEKEGMHPQAMRLASLYAFKDGYSKDRRDWELMFPRPYLDLVEKYAQEYDVAPSLLYGLIRTESAFRSAVVSRAGAVGLMQLMPATARDWADRLRRSGGPDYYNADDTVDSTDPIFNVHIGTYYLKYLQDYFDDTFLALMSYNGGQNRIRRLRSASRLPVDLFIETVTILETRDYGKRVPASARVYQELYYKDRE
jgi:soluble lytic murein transglycosylase